MNPSLALDLASAAHPITMGLPCFSLCLVIGAVLVLGLGVLSVVYDWKRIMPTQRLVSLFEYVAGYSAVIALFVAVIGTIVMALSFIDRADCVDSSENLLAVIQNPRCQIVRADIVDNKLTATLRVPEQTSIVHSVILDKGFDVTKVDSPEQTVTVDDVSLKFLSQHGVSLASTLIDNTTRVAGK
jgi:hypothetical protein